MSIDTSQILIYQSSEGNIKVDVYLEDETVWLTQAQMSVLFDKSKKTISEYITNIFNEGELQEDSVVRKSRITAANGKAYEGNHYNLVLCWNFRQNTKVNRKCQVWMQ